MEVKTDYWFGLGVIFIIAMLGLVFVTTIQMEDLSKYYVAKQDIPWHSGLEIRAWINFTDSPCNGGYIVY